MEAILVFIAGMVKLEMIASVLLLAISVGVVGVMGCACWFIITKLPGILSAWLADFNKAVEKLADSVIRIAADVSNTHQNTVAAGVLLSSHNEQAKQIKDLCTEIAVKVTQGNKILDEIAVTLPYISKRSE